MLKNYARFGGMFSVHYAYVDTDSYLADSLFTKYKIKVKFGDEYRRSDDRYRVIFCKVKKRDEHNFRKALEELFDKALLCGFTNYEKFCEDFCRWTDESKEHA